MGLSSGNSLMELFEQAENFWQKSLQPPTTSDYSLSGKEFHFLGKHGRERAPKAESKNAASDELAKIFGFVRRNSAVNLNGVMNSSFSLK
jgi:hypothetical protein